MFFKSFHDKVCLSSRTTFVVTVTSDILVIFSETELFKFERVSRNGNRQKHGCIIYAEYKIFTCKICFTKHTYHVMY